MEQRIAQLRHLPRDQRHLGGLAIKQGWTIYFTRSNHFKWCAPDGQFIFTAKSPSDHRAIRNQTAFLRRAGLELS